MLPRWLRGVRRVRERLRGLSKRLYRLTAMIALGYLLCIAYACALIALVKWTFTITKTTEIGRKLLHAGAFGILFIAKAFFVEFYHFTILCALGAAFTFFAYQFRFMKSIEREKRTAGEFFYCVSLLIISVVLCFYPELFSCFVAAFAALSIGDGAASVFGKAIPSPKIREEKTFAGTAACMLFTFLPLIVLKWISYVELSYSTIALLAVFTGIAELIGKGLDNFTVPLGTFVCAVLSCLFGQPFEIALLLFIAVFFVAFLSKFITYFGSLLAALIGGTFFFVGGWVAFFYLIGCYALMLAVSLARKLLKAKEVDTVEKTKGKDAVEIFVNGCFPTALMVLYAATGVAAFFAGALCTLSAAFVDSFSSDVGTLSKKSPRDILTGKPLDRGVSGGISMLGTCAAICSTVGFSVAILLITGTPIYFSALIIFSGTLLDSVFGSCLQAKYRCSICDKQTEKKICCNAPTTFEKGVRVLNNDSINFLSLFCVFALCFFLLLI